MLRKIHVYWLLGNTLIESTRVLIIAMEVLSS